MNKNLLYIRADIFNGELIAGGSVTHTTGVINGFIEKGYQVVCASSIMLSILEKIPLNKLIKLKNPKLFSFLRWKLNLLLSNIFFTLTILKQLDRSIDIVYQRYTLLNFTGLLISALKKVPLILEYNGSELWVNNNWATKKWFSFNKLINLIENVNIKKATFIVVVSQVLKEELIARGVQAKKILVNPNGVDVSLYNPEKLTQEREIIRKSLTLENKFVFGFVGTFSPWHGIEILRDTMVLIIQQCPNVHFLLIGDGPLLPMLKNIVSLQSINKHVTFTGIVPHEKAREYLAACDAYVSPTQPNPDGSRFFGSPTKLFEYMSMGKPIIASDIEQLAEVLQPAIKFPTTELNYRDKVGFLMSPTNSKHFIKTACKLITTEKEALTIIGNNAREKVVNHFSWLHHVEKIEKFIERAY